MGRSTAKVILLVEVCSQCSLHILPPNMSASLIINVKPNTQGFSLSEFSEFRLGGKGACHLTWWPELYPQTYMMKGTNSRKLPVLHRWSVVHGHTHRDMLKIVIKKHMKWGRYQQLWWSLFRKKLAAPWCLLIAAMNWPISPKYNYSMFYYLRLSHIWIFLWVLLK